MDDDSREHPTTLREYEEEDLEAVAAVWYRAGSEAYPFLPAWRDLSLRRARKIFAEVIRPRCDIWVGLQGRSVVAFLAMRGSYIDRLYVDPAHQRKGWGSTFIDHAKLLHPQGLELHTHQENRGARRFYERLGFVAVRFGLSPPPENAPDVEYHWRPSNSCAPRGHSTKS